MATDPTKVEAEEIRSFLGLAGYYRKFVKKNWHLEQSINQSFEKRASFCVAR